MRKKLATILLTLALVQLLPPGVPRAHAETQTLERIQKSGQINLGFLVDQPPFSYQSADGKPGGYVIELCGAVVETLRARLQFRELRPKYVRVERTNGLEMVETGQVDLLCVAVPETLKARERVSFSIPIYVGGIGVVVRTNAPPALVKVLSGQVAHSGPNWRATVNGGLEYNVYAVFAGTTSESWVRERLTGLGVIAKVVPVKTYEAGLNMVQGGQADAFFGDRAVLTTLAAQRQESDLQVLDRRFTVEPAALVLQRGDENFRLAVDTALSQLYRSGNVLVNYSRHFGAPTETARMLFQAYSLP